MAASGGRSPRWSKLENARIERRFQASLDNVRCALSGRLQFKFSPAVRSRLAGAIQFDADRCLSLVWPTSSMRCAPIRPPGAPRSTSCAPVSMAHLSLAHRLGCQIRHRRRCCCCTGRHRCAPRAHAARPARRRARARRRLRLVHRRQSRSDFPACRRQGTSRQCLALSHMRMPSCSMSVAPRPKRCVFHWLVSDGNAARKNRKALLNPAATHFGAAAVRNGAVFQVTFCAIAEQFVEKK
jgi:hypothetical protein